VTANGKPHAHYSVFRREDGRRAVVVANMGGTDSIDIEIGFAPLQPAEFVVVSIGQMQSQKWAGKAQLCPGCALVAFEA